MSSLVAEAGDGSSMRDGAGDDGPPRRRRRWRRLAGELAVLAIIAVVVAVVVRAFLFQAYYIPSPSMVPTLKVNDRVVVSRVSHDLHDARRGDIVVFSAPPGEAPPTPHRSTVGRLVHDAGVDLGVSSDETVLIKRVIALPGETVQGHDGHVYVDGHLLLEPYLPPGDTTSDFGPDTIPAGMVWVMGDNRGDSTDSRVFGPIPERTIVGRAVWRIWPPWRLGFL